MPGKSLVNLLVYAEYEFIDVKHSLRFTGLLNQRKMYESGNKAFLGLALCEATLTRSHLNLWLFGELGFWGQGTKNACTDKTLNSKTGCKKKCLSYSGCVLHLPAGKGLFVRETKREEEQLAKAVSARLLTCDCGRHHCVRVSLCRWRRTRR